MRKSGKAMVLMEFNKPLRLKNYPLLDPESGAILVKVIMAGACGTDVHLCHGHYPMPLPVILGHETIGIVESIGQKEVSDLLGNPLSVGDKVFIMSSIPCGSCYFCRILGDRNLCESRLVYGANQSSIDPPHFSGGFAEYMYLRPGTGMVKIPEEIDSEEVISLGCAGPTAVNGVIYQTKITLGDTVLVQGAGPVGIAACMMARLSGAKKIIMVGGPKNRIKFAEELNLADFYINIFEVTDIEERVKIALEQTDGGRGADVVLECAGFPTAVQEGWKVVRKNGKYLVLGHYTDKGPILLNPSIITQKQMKIFGSFAFVEPHYLKFVELVPLLKQRYDLKKLVTLFPLEKANDALKSVEKGEVIKAVIKLS
jgi:threonine dehydrogenase-like Zn-dependent dehydrogenase